MPIWDGHDRRNNSSDHDTLVTMVQLIKSHIDNFEIHRKDFYDHKQEDKESFGWVRKIIYMGMGSLATLQIVILFIKH